jgi:hypothetical protein
MILSLYAFALAIGAQSGRRRGAASQAWIPLGRTIWIADAHRGDGGPAQRDVPTKKAAPAWSNEPEPGHNRGDDLPADDTQLPSVGR